MSLKTSSSTAAVLVEALVLPLMSEGPRGLIACTQVTFGSSSFTRSSTRFCPAEKNSLLTASSGLLNFCSSVAWASKTPAVGCTLGGNSSGMACFCARGTSMSRLETSPDERSMRMTTRRVSSVAETTRMLDSVGRETGQLADDGNSQFDFARFLVQTNHLVAGANPDALLVHKNLRRASIVRRLSRQSWWTTNPCARMKIVDHDAGPALASRIFPPSKNSVRQPESVPASFIENARRGLEPTKLNQPQAPSAARIKSKTPATIQPIRRICRASAWIFRIVALARGRAWAAKVGTPAAGGARCGCHAQSRLRFLFRFRQSAR